MEKELLLLKSGHPALSSSVGSVVTETRQSAEFRERERAAFILSELCSIPAFCLAKTMLFQYD